MNFEKENTKSKALILTWITIGSFLIAGIIFILTGGYSEKDFLDHRINEERTFTINEVEEIAIRSSSYDIYVEEIDSDVMKVQLIGAVKVVLKKT